MHGKDGFKLDENGLRKGFEYFDQNRNGALSKGELHAILTNKRSGNAFSDEEGKKVAEDIIKRFAKTNGEELEYEEVYRVALPPSRGCPTSTRDDFDFVPALPPAPYAVHQVVCHQGGCTSAGGAGDGSKYD